MFLSGWVNNSLMILFILLSNILFYEKSWIIFLGFTDFSNFYWVLVLLFWASYCCLPTPGLSFLFKKIPILFMVSKYAAEVHINFPGSLLIKVLISHCPSEYVEGTRWHCWNSFYFLDRIDSESMSLLPLIFYCFFLSGVKNRGESHLQSWELRPHSKESGLDVTWSIFP